VRTIDVSVFEKNFPALDARANSHIKLLLITCGTADSLIGVNRQFKDWFARSQTGVRTLHLRRVHARRAA
jgi:hypothetical protein